MGERDMTTCMYAQCHEPATLTSTQTFGGQAVRLCDDHQRERWWPRDLIATLRKIKAGASAERPGGAT